MTSIFYRISFCYAVTIKLSFETYHNHFFHFVDCFEITLTKESGHRVDPTEVADNKTDVASYMYSCFKWACESTPLLCSASFDSSNKDCYKYTKCVPNCKTVEDSSWEIVTKICHDEVGKMEYNSVYCVCFVCL